MNAPVAYVPPDPLWIYHHGLPYQFPLVDQQPVVRIPVAGPDPYDTLAVVRTVAAVGAYAWSDSGYHPQPGVVVPTGLVSPAAAEGAPPRHSSSAVLRMQQISAQWDDSGPIPLDDDNTTFTYAVDAVRAESHFDATGRWCVTVDTAWQAWQVYAACTVEVSSWVLLEEGRARDEPFIDTLLQTDSPTLPLPPPLVVREVLVPVPDPSNRRRPPKRVRDVR